MNSKSSAASDTPKFVANYIENFIDFVENVPNDLSRKISRIHELQLDYESFLGKLESNLIRFSKHNANELKQLKLLLETQHCLVRMQELSDVKLSITQDAYDQLDNKSRELDHNFQLINAATSDGTEGNGSNSNNTNNTNNNNKNSKNNVSKVVSSSSSSQAKTNIQSSPEPTYCVCNQVSYGDMICCDNDACQVEWFHFQCVSLTSKPKGKWYCPSCRGDRSNQPKK